MNIKHSLRHHKLYDSWCRMKSRCYNAKNPKYHRYGGRGVIVCSEWLNDFKSYYDWAIENGWKNGMQIDKDIKAAKLGKEGLIYSPEWCSVVSVEENANYRKGSVFFEINGEIKNIMQWCAFYNIKQSTFYHRHYVQKLSIIESLTKPSRTPSIKPDMPPRCKIDWDIAAKIREKHISGLSNIKIGKEFGLDASTVSNIVNNKSWAK